MFLVTKMNRVVDYCESGYYYVGNVVVCQSKGCKFEDATIVYTDKEIPKDIDSISYDYINGEFIKHDEVFALKEEVYTKKEIDSKRETRHTTLQSGSWIGVEDGKFKYCLQTDIELKDDADILIDLDSEATIEQRRSAEESCLYGYLSAGGTDTAGWRYYLWIGCTADNHPQVDIPIKVMVMY